MIYFFDTEFLETALGDGQVKIELISIGIVSEDGDEFYAENIDFDWSKLSDDEWLVKNVKPHLKGGKCAMSIETMRSDLESWLDDDPKWWAWVGAHDWLCLLSIWGRLLDRPKGWANRYVEQRSWVESKGYKGRGGLPRLNEDIAHDALEDAKWNREVWLFVKQEHDI